MQMPRYAAGPRFVVLGLGCGAWLVPGAGGVWVLGVGRGVGPEKRFHRYKFAKILVMAEERKEEERRIFTQAM